MKTWLFSVNPQCVDPLKLHIIYIILTTIIYAIVYYLRAILNLNCNIYILWYIYC